MTLQSQKASLAKTCFTFLFVLVITGCRDDSEYLPSEYVFTQPQYDLVELRETNDTLHFSLDDHSYNDVKSFNLFHQNSIDYISFHDRRSESINIYDFNSRNLVKRISLKKLFKNRQLFKTSVYIKSFDSIFITNKTKLYLFDSSGLKKTSISFVEDPAYAWPVLESNNQPIIKHHRLYAIVRPTSDANSPGALKKWNILYEFNLRNGTAKLHYHLPKLYHRKLYGYYFLDYNFCYNQRGRFVFSFPADTVLYETNLIDYHKAYFARSQYLKGDIPPVEEAALKDDAGLKAYAVRDSYGPVFFDPETKYYLRLAKQKISESDYLNKNRKRNQTVLILNEDFKIIGESPFSNDINFNSLIFGPHGNIYARVNATDENALHFIQLRYETNHQSSQITKK